MKKVLAFIVVLMLLMVGCGADSSIDSTTNGNYIANRNSGKLHYYTCDSLPYEQNRIYFATEAEANAAGYTDNHKECMNNRF